MEFITQSLVDTSEQHLRSTVKPVSKQLAAHRIVPLPCVITTCRFRVAAFSGHAALALSPSDMAPKLSRGQLPAIFRCGQSGED